MACMPCMVLSAMTEVAVVVLLMILEVFVFEL